MLLEDQVASPKSPTNRPCHVPGLRLRIVDGIARFGTAAILAQTLFFKFTYAPETQAIFAERGGRLAATAVGLAELVAALLLVLPRTAAIGSLLALGLIGGAIFTHLTSLGIVVADDGGFLFGLAVTIATLASIVLAIRWRQLPFVPERFR